jgi:hypothetical protein
MTVFVRLRPGCYVRADQVAAITEAGDGFVMVHLLSGFQIKAPELTARKVLSAMQREVEHQRHAAGVSR